MNLSTPSVFGLALLALVPAAWAQPSAAAVQVTAAQMRQLAPVVTAAGQVQSRDAAALSSALAGTLAWVAEPGSWLEAGAEVARLDADELMLQKAEQAARLQRMEVTLEQAERELKRLQGSGSAVSQFQLDQARATRDLARSDLRIARVSLQQTEERLSRTHLRAPFAGVVSERLKRAGEEVARGEQVARLVDPEQMEIRLYVPLRHVRAVKPGSVVTASGERGAFEASVHSVIPAGDGRSQSFEVRVLAPAGVDWLAPGQTLRVSIPLGLPAQRLAVPRDALIIRTDGVFVMRVNGEQKAERVGVSLGVADGDWIAVEGELQEGDPVIIRGGESLRGGEAVKVLSPRPV